MAPVDNNSYVIMAFKKNVVALVKLKLRGNSTDN